LTRQDSRYSRWAFRDVKGRWREPGIHCAVLQNCTTARGRLSTGCVCLARSTIFNTIAPALFLCVWFKKMSAFRPFWLENALSQKWPLCFSLRFPEVANLSVIHCTQNFEVTTILRRMERKECLRSLAAESKLNDFRTEQPA
jgi:hypothetical protein